MSVERSPEGRFDMAYKAIFQSAMQLYNPWPNECLQHAQLLHERVLHDSGHDLQARDNFQTGSFDPRNTPAAIAPYAH